MTKEPGLTHLLLGLCGVFALINGAEWVYLTYGISQTKKEIKKPVDSNVAFDKIGSHDFVLPPEESFSGIVERPVMIRGRRSVSEITPEPVAPVVSRGNTQIKLMGIVMTPNGMTALLKNGKGAYKRLEIDGIFDGWELDELHADRVVLTRGGSTQELKLRKPKPKKQAANIRNKVQRKRNKSPVQKKKPVKPGIPKQGGSK